jgi:hypothetical protein
MIHISKLHGKLEKFKAISTNTRTNKFCSKMFNTLNDKVICTKCYSWSTLNKGMYPALEPALERNSELLASRILKDNELPVIKDSQFRFNAHGELINITHLQNYVNIVNKNPSCHFSLWTKRKDMIRKYFKNPDNEKPDNLILIYSNPIISKIMRHPPEYFEKTFNNVMDNEFKEQQNCTGQKCIDCLKCYRHNEDNIIVEKVKRR